MILPHFGVALFWDDFLLVLNIPHVDPSKHRIIQSNTHLHHSYQSWAYFRNLLPLLCDQCNCFVSICGNFLWQLIPNWFNISNIKHIIANGTTVSSKGSSTVKNINTLPIRLPFIMKMKWLSSWYTSQHVKIPFRQHSAHKREIISIHCVTIQIHTCSNCMLIRLEIVSLHDDAVLA